MLRDDDFGDSLGLDLLGVVVLIAIDEHDDIGILFHCSRFAEVTETRTLVLA